MSLVQVKVIYDYYTSKRITPFFIAEDELLEYDFQAFKERIVREVPHLGKVTSLSTAPLRFTINEEEHEVDISPVYFSFQLKEALSKRKTISVQAFTFQSPSVEEVRISRASQLRTSEDKPHARRSLQLKGSLKHEDYEKVDLCREQPCKSDAEEFCQAPIRENTKEKTPVERYIQKTEDEITKKQELISRLENKEQEIQAKLDRVKSDPRDGNICRNCHLRLGHSARTCEFGRCTSVFKCGEEKFHSGEINLKELRTQIRKHETELSKLKKELDNKTIALESMKEKATNKIESDLFEANRDDYLLNGNKNWSLLRKHVYLVEQYSKKHFRGKIPAKKDITAVLQRALDSCDELSNTSMSRPKQKRREDNPAKSTLERHGIKFPRFSSLDNISDVEQISEPPPLLYTAPKNQREEAEQLAIVMRESLRQNYEESSQGIFPSFEKNRVLPPVLGYSPMGIPFYNYEMARMSSCVPSFSYELSPTGTTELTSRPTSTYTSTCANTNPTSTADCPSLPESQTDLSAAETAANLLLCLSQRKESMENT